MGHSFSSLLSCSPPTHLLPFPSTPPSSLFRKGQASLGLKQSLSYQAEVGLIYPHIKADQCNPAWEIGFQKSAKCLRQILISLLEVLQTEQTIQLSHTCWGPRSIPCSFPNCWLRVQAGQLSLWVPFFHKHAGSNLDSSSDHVSPFPCKSLLLLTPHIFLGTLTWRRSLAFQNFLNYSTF